MNRPLLDDSATAVELDDDADERCRRPSRRRRSIDRDHGATVKSLRRADTVGGEDREPTDQLLAVAIRHDDFATDAVFAARRNPGAEPAAGQGVGVVDVGHPRARVDREHRRRRHGRLASDDEHARRSRRSARSGRGWRDGSRLHLASSLERGFERRVAVAGKDRAGTIRSDGLGREHRAARSASRR